MPGSEKVSIRLESCLDFSSVQALAVDFLNALTDAQRVRITASDLEQIGTPGLQVLLSAYLQANANGQAFEVEEDAEVLRAAMEDLGLDEFVQKWSNA